MEVSGSNHDGENQIHKGNQSLKAKKMPWTEEEDNLVYSLVQQYGA